MKKLLYLLLLFLPVLGCAQSRYGVEGVPVCWRTPLGVDSSLNRYVIISTTGKPVQTIVYENANGVVVSVSGGSLRYGYCDCIDFTVPDSSVTWEMLTEPVKDSIRFAKRDTFITVPPSENYFQNNIDNPAKFYNNIYLSCKGRTDTSIVVFLAAPVFEEQKGVVYHIKNDSGLVAAFVINYDHLSNNKRFYLLKRGQTAQVRLLPDAALEGNYRWAVNVVWDSIGGGGGSTVYTPNDSTDTGLQPSVGNGIVNILKYTGNSSVAVPSFGLVPNWYNEDGAISTERTATLSGSNGDYYILNGTSNSKILDLYFSADGQYNNDSYFSFEMSKTNQTNNFGNFNWSHYVYGPSGKTYSIAFNGTAERSSSSNTGAFYNMDLRRASGTFIIKHLMQIDSVGRFYNYLEFKSDSLSGAGRKHISGFAYKTQTSGQTVIVAPTKSWLLQTNFFNSSTKFDWLRVDNLDTDTTSNRISFYNNKYAFPNTRPSATSSAISNLIWTAGTPSFLRSQHKTTSGTTDGSGDITITFDAAMPDATYTVIVTGQGTTPYVYMTQSATLATGSVKVRMFTLAGSAATSTAYQIAYEVKDTN